VAEIVAQLKMLATQESLQVEPEALTLIARQSTGSLRDAISLLDQLASVGGLITLKTAQAVLGTATNQLVIDLVDAVLNRQAAGGLNLIHRALDAGADPRQFARQAVEYLRGLLLARLGSIDQVDATQEVRQKMVQQAQAFETAHLMETLRTFNSAANDERTGWQPGLALEMAFASAIEPAVQTRPAVAANPSPQPAHQASPSHLTAQPATAAAQAPENPTTSQRSAAIKNEGLEVPQPVSQPKASPAVKTPEPAPADPAGALSAEPVSGVVSLSKISQSWPQIRAQVKKRNNLTEGLLNSCKPLGVKENVLILGFASEVLKSKMEQGDNLQITQAAVLQVLGVALQVSCTIASANKPGKHHSDVEVDNDGMVGTALRDLGGEIVDVI
jgi:DNA polymerase-3 subunit gamma/tau